MPSLNTVNYTLGILSIVALVGGWWIAGRSKRKTERERISAERTRNEAVGNVILGEPAILDATGGELQPAKPGLGARTTTLEQAIGKLVDQDQRLTVHEARLNEHDASIAVLIAAKFEAGAKDNLAAVENQQKNSIDGEATE